MKEGYVIWFTGKHGAGKSTISVALGQYLKSKKTHFVLLDGDKIRKTISSDLGYSIEDRNKHMKRVADICKLISENGILSIASVASPTEESRQYPKSIIKNFILVYTECPTKVCEERDVKGHYKKAKNKEKGFENFVGIAASFEEPQNPDIVLHTDKENPSQSTKKLIGFLKSKKIIK